MGRSAMLMLDFLIAAGSIMAAYIARFEGAISEIYFRQLLFLLPVFALLRIAINWKVGLYRMIWRYVGLGEALKITQSVVAASGILFLVRVTLYQFNPLFVIPFGIIFIDAILCMLGMVGVRFVPRIVAELRAKKKASGVSVLMVGATDVGTAVAREALRNPELGILPIGFIDNNAQKSAEVQGIPVMGTRRDLPDLLAKANISEVIVTDPSLTAKEMWALIDTCGQYGVRVRVASQPFQFSTQKNPVGKSTLRDIQIEDLLQRDPIAPSLSMDDLREKYQNSVIMVTGAGGSIGSELCRQLAQLSPRELILVERDETNLFEIERELVAGDALISPMLADVTNQEEMEELFESKKPTVIFHAAAYKHVPLMEKFPHDAIHNNVIGTKTLVELAKTHHIDRFVLVSTDKAVRPTSVMGATKRVAEMVVRSVAKEADGRYCCVRFGNVLGSRGSVVGIFREQIRKGGPITVTHPDATRYFMTIPEAANLVIQSGTIGQHGDVFMLDMGAPVRILDLAKQMIRLSGMSEEEIEIRITGVRPGEKLFEELQADNESLEATDLRKVRRSKVDEDDIEAETLVQKMRFVMRSKDPQLIRRQLLELNIGYVPKGNRHGTNDL